MEDKIKAYNDKIKKIKPSEYKESPWLYCLSKNYKKPDNSKETKTGKWCIFGKESVVEKYWKKIIPIVENSDLINSAKIRSGQITFYNMLNGYDNKKVICIYNNDYDDTDTIFKIRDLIRKEVGVKTIIKYKRDIDTINQVSGEKEFIFIDKIK